MKKEGWGKIFVLILFLSVLYCLYYFSGYISQTYNEIISESMRELIKHLLIELIEHIRF